MIENFLELVAHSDESVLLGYKFSGGTLHVSLRMSNVDEFTVDVSARTEIVIANVPASEGPAYRTCFIELIKPVDELSTNQHGLYIPSTNFGKMIKEIRSGLGLVYGRHINEVEYILRFRGNLLVACPVSQSRDLGFTIRET